jgi:hypothetical protein
MVGLQLLLLSMALATVHGQTLPQECTNLDDWRPMVGSGERIGADHLLRRALDSILPASVYRSPAGQLPPALAAIWNADSIGTKVALAEAVTTPSLYGTDAATAAADFYSMVGGDSHPMLLMLGLSHDASRVAMGLRAIRNLNDRRERAAVLMLACNAVWQLLPFLNDTTYAAHWRTAHYDNWPGLATSTITQAKRLLGASFPASLTPLLDRLQRSALAPDEPF